MSDTTVIILLTMRRIANVVREHQLSVKIEYKAKQTLKLKIA